MEHSPTPEEILEELRSNILWLDKRMEEKDRLILQLLAEQRQRQPRLVFPFSLLVQVIAAWFRLLERAISRLVKRIIR